MSPVVRSIMVVGSYAPSLVNFRGDLISTMASRGYNVIAAAPGEDVEMIQRLSALGACFQSMRLSRTGLNPFADLTAIYRFVQVFRFRQPHAVLLYTAKPVIYGAIAARMARVPHTFALITGLGYAFMPGTEIKRQLLRRLMSTLYKIALSRCDLVFFQNTDDLSDFRKLGILPPARQAVVVPGSGVNLSHFRKSEPPSGPPTFLLAARLVRDKGVREYVAAARLLRAKHPQARFVLIGPHDSNPAAISMSELLQWQMEGVVLYQGALTDIRSAFEACSVYVLPSYREGMPRTVLEAMAAGRAIITTDVPGCRETVAPGRNGFLVPPRDAEALASAMERFLQKPELIAQMGACSRALAEAQFDVQRVNAAMLQAMGL